MNEVCELSRLPLQRLRLGHQETRVPHQHTRGEGEGGSWYCPGRFGVGLWACTSTYIPERQNGHYNAPALVVGVVHVAAK